MITALPMASDDPEEVEARRVARENRRHQILAIIAQSLRSRGFSPSYGEIGRLLDTGDGPLVSGIIRNDCVRMEESGLLELYVDETTSRRTNVVHLNLTLKGWRHLHYARVRSGTLDP
ncbi:MAG: hypothetical protein ACI81R_001906 [Bradymonadia bacterium]|jgi:hypothetical protein